MYSFFQDVSKEVNGYIINFWVLGIYFELYSLPDFTKLNALDVYNSNCGKDGWQYNFNGFKQVKSYFNCKTTFDEFSV
jgi:hypothetical protein